MDKFTKLQIMDLLVRRIVHLIALYFTNHKGGINMDWFNNLHLVARGLKIFLILIVLNLLGVGCKGPKDIKFDDIVYHESYINDNIDDKEDLKDYLEIDKEHNNDLSKYYLYLTGLDTEVNNPLIQLHKNRDLSSIDGIDKYIKYFKNVDKDYIYYKKIKYKFLRDINEINTFLIGKLFKYMNGTYEGKYSQGLTSTIGTLILNDSVCNKKFSGKTERGILYSFTFASDTVDDRSNIKGRNTFFASWKSSEGNTASFQMNTKSPESNEVYYGLGTKYWKLNFNLEYEMKTKKILNKVLWNLNFLDQYS